MDNLEFEKKYISCGLKFVAGVDEVGRGPLAGPVVCCAVIMPIDDIIYSRLTPYPMRQNSRKKLHRFETLMIRSKKLLSQWTKSCLIATNRVTL